MAPLDLSSSLSVKWVGFFVTALVGLYTIEDLWDKFGDLSMPFVRSEIVYIYPGRPVSMLTNRPFSYLLQRTYVRHWVARIIGFIVLPISVYLFCFKLHFLILHNTGPGDSQMSSLFQANLNGNDFAQNPLGKPSLLFSSLLPRLSRHIRSSLSISLPVCSSAEAAFGSKLTLKNIGYGGGLLHSHVQTYPVGSLQQQVTCYHYKDDNNAWIITPTWEAPPISDEETRFLQDGDTIRLVHASTGRNLHSHPIAAPVSKLSNEISCYGNATVGDSNDYWVVEVVDDTVKGRKENLGGKINSLTTRMRFRHLNSGCYVRAANTVLPQWGFKQIEVSCDKENNPRDVHTYWNVESHWNEKREFFFPPSSFSFSSSV
jgi:dolichyl-phosphate-mannose-protein mannosyltransferase